MPKGKSVEANKFQARPDASVQTTKEFEAWVLIHADYFTRSIRIGPGKHETKEFPTLRQAIESKKEVDVHSKTKYYGRKALVYACMRGPADNPLDGRWVCIGEEEYEAALRQRGEF